MIWEHFPVGMSFPVSDDSEETKKRCWAITLAALAAGGDYAEMTLYDNCPKGLPGSADREYLCIMHHRQVSQSRANIAVWKQLSALNACLSLHYPLYQANAIDSFGPYEQLAVVEADGTLRRSAAGEALLPARLPDPMPLPDKDEVLIALKAKPHPLGWSYAARRLGALAAEAGHAVRYCPIADGGIGSTYALTYAKRGRFEWLKTRDTSGEAKQILLGVMPRFTAAIDCAALIAEGERALAPAAALAEVIQKILNLGYRNMILALDGFPIGEPGAEFASVLADPEHPDALDPRLSEGNILLLTSDRSLVEGKTTVSGSLLHLIRLGARFELAATATESVIKLSEKASGAKLLFVSECADSPLLKKSIRSDAALHTVSDDLLSDPERLDAVMKRELSAE